VHLPYSNLLLQQNQLFYFQVNYFFMSEHQRVATWIQPVMFSPSNSISVSHKKWLFMFFKPKDFHNWPCEIRPRDDLFSDDFGFKMNTLASNFAHILILRRPLLILSKNIVYLEGISSMETMETRGEPSDNWYFAKGQSSQQSVT
jgi:hypothetical protein